MDIPYQNKTKKLNIALKIKCSNATKNWHTNIIENRKVMLRLKNQEFI